jgi:hypothetical protein
MKRILCIAVFVYFLASGCHVEKDIQVDIMDVRLVKVDTVFRDDARRKVLTWEGSDRMKYYSFVELNNYMPVGTRMRMLVKR